MVGIDTTLLVQLEIAELPLHEAAHDLLRREVLDRGEVLALAPQVLPEFLHVVTDPKRFARPLSMEEAIAKARFWLDAREVRHVYPAPESSRLFLEWMAKHGLGRKRLLDTQLAATLWSVGVRRVMTSNVRDFSLFGFQILSP